MSEEASEMYEEARDAMLRLEPGKYYGGVKATEKNLDRLLKVAEADMERALIVMKNRKRKRERHGRESDSDSDENSEDGESYECSEGGYDTEECYNCEREHNDGPHHECDSDDVG